MADLVEEFKEQFKRYETSNRRDVAHHWSITQHPGQTVEDDILEIETG